MRKLGFIGTSCALVGLIVFGLGHRLLAGSANAPSAQRVPFQELSGFPFPLTPDLEWNTNRPAWADEQVNAMIPADIRALNGQRVSVEGFMVPLEYEQGKLVGFMLTRDQKTCCYGLMPQVDQWIKVRVKPPGIPSMMDQVLQVQGTLHVGAEREDGDLCCVYSLDADDVIK